MRVRTCYRTIRPEPVVVLVLNYEVMNLSRVPCYKWAVNLTMVSPDGAEADCIVSHDELQRASGGIPLPEDPTILPTLTKECQGELGFLVRTDRPLREQVEQWLALEARYSAISEHYIGQDKMTQLSSVADGEAVLQAVQSALEEKGVQPT